MAGLAHIGVGFAISLLAPEAPVLGVVAAAEALDLLCIPAALCRRGSAFVLATTHSLPASIIWSGVAMGVAALAHADLRTILVIGLAVFSHWILDFITHPMGAIMGPKPRRPQPPDLPLGFSPASKKIGLGLYNYSFPVSVVFDLGVTVLGAAAYFLRWVR
ncbi:MAG: metal-dependent hydrolase [Rectinemataceae bacterium]